ncbi:MAG: hypothetical protein IKY70_02490 [Bacteroidales bacterium]|nr:hypothetical protein [Bacteroidales bacterium]
MQRKYIILIKAKKWHYSRQYVSFSLWHNLGVEGWRSRCIMNGLSG